MYKGFIHEDLKQIAYLLGALSNQEPNDANLRRYVDAVNHALQILDRNPKVVTAYEEETNTGTAFFNSLATRPLDTERGAV